MKSSSPCLTTLQVMWNCSGTKWWKVCQYYSIYPCQQLKKSIKKTIFCLFSSSLNLHKVMQCPFNIFLIPLCFILIKWLCVCFFCFILVLFVYNFRWSVSVYTEQKVPWIPTCQENTSPNQCKTGPNSVQCSYDEELHKWPVLSKELPPWSCKTTGMSGRSTLTYLLRASWHIKLQSFHLSWVAAMVFASFHDCRPASTLSFSTVCLQVVSGFPLVLFLSGAQLIAMLQCRFFGLVLS